MSGTTRTQREARPAQDVAAVIHLPPPRPKRQRGRRPALNPKTADIWLRTTPARKASIVDAAERAGMSLTDYLFSHLPGADAARRFKAVTGLDRESKQLVVKVLAELGKLGSNHNQLARQLVVKVLAELGKLGSNHNQLARRRNITGDEPDNDE